jgi:hypothetical protein
VSLSRGYLESCGSVSGRFLLIVSLCPSSFRRLGATTVATLAFQYLLHHADELFDSRVFLELSSHWMKRLVQSSRMAVQCEAVVVGAVWKWAAAHTSLSGDAADAAVLSNLAALLPCVRLMHLSMKDLDSRRVNALFPPTPLNLAMRAKLAPWRKPAPLTLHGDRDDAPFLDYRLYQPRRYGSLVPTFDNAVDHQQSSAPKERTSLSKPVPTMTQKLLCMHPYVLHSSFTDTGGFANQRRTYRWERPRASQSAALATMRVVLVINPLLNAARHREGYTWHVVIDKAVPEGDEDERRGPLSAMLVPVSGDHKITDLSSILDGAHAKPLWQLLPNGCCTADALPRSRADSVCSASSAQTPPRPISFHQEIIDEGPAMEATAPSRVQTVPIWREGSSLFLHAQPTVDWRSVDEERPVTWKRNSVSSPAPAAEAVASQDRLPMSGIHSLVEGPVVWRVQCASQPNFTLGLTPPDEVFAPGGSLDGLPVGMEWMSAALVGGGGQEVLPAMAGRSVLPREAERQVAVMETVDRRSPKKSSIALVLSFESSEWRQLEVTLVPVPPVDLPGQLTHQ